MGTLHYSGTDFIVEPSDLDETILADLMDCGGPGQADAAVAYVISNHDITGDPDDCRAMLQGYGSWDDEELGDHDENLARLVWLTGCSLNEGESAYFSTY